MTGLGGGPLVFFIVQEVTEAQRGSVTCPQALPKSKGPGHPRAAWLESACPQRCTAHRACAVVGKRSFLVLG